MQRSNILILLHPLKKAVLYVVPLYIVLRPEFTRVEEFLNEIVRVLSRGVDGFWADTIRQRPFLGLLLCSARIIVDLNQETRGFFLGLSLRYFLLNVGMSMRRRLSRSTSKSGYTLSKYYWFLICQWSTSSFKLRPQCSFRSSNVFLIWRQIFEETTWDSGLRSGIYLSQNSYSSSAFSLFQISSRVQSYFIRSSCLTLNTSRSTGRCSQSTTHWKLPLVILVSQNFQMNLTTLQVMYLNSVWSSLSQMSRLQKAYQSYCLMYSCSCFRIFVARTLIIVVALWKSEWSISSPCQYLIIIPPCFLLLRLMKFLNELIVVQQGSCLLFCIMVLNQLQPISFSQPSTNWITIDSLQSIFPNSFLCANTFSLYLHLLSLKVFWKKVAVSLSLGIYLKAESNMSLFMKNEDISPSQQKQVYETNTFNPLVTILLAGKVSLLRIHERQLFLLVPLSASSSILFCLTCLTLRKALTLVSLNFLHKSQKHSFSMQGRMEVSLISFSIVFIASTMYKFIGIISECVHYKSLRMGTARRFSTINHNIVGGFEPNQAYSKTRSGSTWDKTSQSFLAFPTSVDTQSYSKVYEQCDGPLSGLMFSVNMIVTGQTVLKVKHNSYHSYQPTMKGQVVLLVTLLCMLSVVSPQATSISPIWLGSTLYQTSSTTVTVPGTKTGTVSFGFAKAFDSSNGNGVQSLIFGLHTMSQTSGTTSFSVQLSVLSTTSTGGSIKFTIGSSTSITAFTIRTLGLAKSVTVLNTYTNLNLGQFCQCNMSPVNTGSGTRTLSFNGNFYNSTGRTINLTNTNFMLVFVQGIDMTTSNGIFSYSTNSEFISSQFYRFNLTANGNTRITSFFYNRIIYDQTAIQSSQTIYLDGGSMQATNSNYSQLSHQFYFSSNLSFMVGLTSFSITTSATLNWNFNVNNISTTGTLAFNSMVLAYWNYRYRTCPTGYNYYNQTDNLCYNQCNVYYYPNSTLSSCIPCFYACANCTSSSNTSCTACQASDHRALSANKCVCQPGFYENGTPTCLACDPSCATCSNSSYCVTCVSGILPTAGQCLCPTGQVNIGNGQCGTCNQAIVGCLTCTSAGALVTCTSCNGAQFMSLSNGICVCISGYTNGTGNTCVPCSSVITGCVMCTSPTVCTNCNTPSNFQLAGSICNCTTGYYLDSVSKACVLCSSVLTGCSACSSQTVCTSCIAPFQLLAPATTCTCPSGTYVGLTLAVCKPCINVPTPGCVTCANVSYCLTCDASMNLMSDGLGHCICKPTYFYDGSVCNPCAPGCLNCISATVCTACEGSPMTMDGTGSACDCDPGYYFNGNTCILCLTTFAGCLNCTMGGCSFSYCNGSIGFQYPSSPGTLVQCVCSAGFYQAPGSNLCTPCAAGCLVCSTGTDCTACDTANNFNLTGPNSCECDTGYVLNPTQQLCVQCSVYAIGCNNCIIVSSIFTCYGCDAIFTQATNFSCQCAPPSTYNAGPSPSCGSLDPLQTIPCQPGQYFDSANSTACQSCPPGCMSCSDSSTCYQCDITTNYFLVGSLCTSITNCTVSNCVACSVSQGACQACDSTLNLVLINNQCVCVAGMTLSTTPAAGCVTCFSLMPGCTECSTISAAQCYTCYPDFTPNPITGVCECTDPTKYAEPTLCSACSVPGCDICATQTTCSLCRASDDWNTTVIANGTCVCATGYFQNNSLCNPCGVGCLQCASAINCSVCDTNNDFILSGLSCICINGYFLDATPQCSPCNAGCLTCDLLNCTVCDATNNYVANSSDPLNCQCTVGYFLSPQSLNCQPCNTLYMGCLQCTPLLCTLCNNTMYTGSPPGCRCKDGMYNNSVTCSDCSSLFIGCLLCSASACIQCDGNATANYVLDTSGINCVCMPIYFGYQGVCKLCSSVIVGCLACNVPTICTSCDTTNNFVLALNGSCQCTDTYFLNATNQCQLCSNEMVGCVSCNSSTYCIHCNELLNFEQASTGQCECEQQYNLVGTQCLNCSQSCATNCPGYYFNNATSCIPKCGDGILISGIENCDDGNLVNGDGCDSRCNVENNFTCTLIGTSSLCSYSLPITLTLLTFTKDPYCNCLNFTINVGPPLASFSDFDFISAITASLPLFNGTFTYQDGKLILSYQYNQTLENNNLTFFFAPFNDTRFINTPSSQTDLNLVLPSNQPIVVYNDEVYQARGVSTKALIAAQALAYVTMLIGLFCNKIIGLELMGVLQISFFVMADINLVNPILAPLLYMKSVNGFNLNTELPGSDVPTRISAMSYKSLFLNNFNVMLALPLIVLTLSLIIYLVGKFKPNGEKLVKMSKHLVKEYFLTVVVFSLYNISFSAGVQFQYPSQGSSQFINDLVALASLCLPISVVCLLAFADSSHFGEFRSSFRRQLMARNYFVISISYRMILGFLIAYQNNVITITIINVFLSILFFMYLIVNIPFKRGYHNYRAGIAQLTTTTVLSVGMYYRSMKANSELDMKSQILAPAYIQLSMIFLCIAVSMASLTYELHNKLKAWLHKHKEREVVRFQNVSVESIFKETQNNPID